jgi:hypothetical protein
MNIKSKWILPFLVAISIALITKKATIQTEDPRFRDSTFVLDNLNEFYHYLQMSESPSSYNYHCYNVSQKISKEVNLEKVYYGYKILKDLKCELDKKILANALEAADLKSSFVDIYYGFTFNTIIGSPKEVVADLCELITKFTNPQNPRIKINLKDKADTLEYGSMALKIFKECAKIKNQYITLAQSYASSLRNELKFITKSSAAWISENPVSTTIQITTSLLYTNRNQISNEVLGKILTYLEMNVTLKSTLKELLEWNNLLMALDSINYKLIQIPGSIDLTTCSSKCQLIVENLPDNSKAEITINGKTISTDLSKDGVINLNNIDFNLNSVANIKIINSEFSFYQTNKVIEIKHDNKISFTRMKTSAFNIVNDLMDSDDSECSSISLTGNESTFLHVGYRMKIHENFSFVHLQPENIDFEDSALIHSTYNEKEKLYISIFDFSDYEIIRPNSDTYNIWITVGDVRKQCGKITLNFMNKELSKRDPIDSAYSTPLVVNRFQIHEKKRYIVTGFYFLIVVICFAVAYATIFKRKFGNVSFKNEFHFGGILFYASLLLYVLTLYYLLSISQLIERAWIPILEIFLVMITFKKSFYNR